MTAATSGRATQRRGTGALAPGGEAEPLSPVHRRHSGAATTKLGSHVLIHGTKMISIRKMIIA